MTNEQSTPGQSNPPTHGEPYCGHCGYVFAGLDDISRCPECGKAIVDVLVRRGTGAVRPAKRYTSDATLWGLPVISIAFGPRPEFGETMGKAKGIIAIGDVAVGGIAIGGRAFGVVSVGGFAVGIASVGGCSIGLASAIGGMAIGGLALGGGAIGGLAIGGGAASYAAKGGGAWGYYAAGGGAGGKHTITHQTADPAAVQAFDDLSWYFGTGGLGGNSMAMFSNAAVSIALVTLACAFVVGVFALVGERPGTRRNPFEGPGPGDRA